MKVYHIKTGGNIDIQPHRAEAMAKKGWLPKKPKKKSFKPKYQTETPKQNEGKELDNGNT